MRWVLEYKWNVAKCKTKYKKHLQGRLVKMVCSSFKCSMMRRVTTNDRFERWKEYAKDAMKMTKAKVNGMEFKKPIKWTFLNEMRFVGWHDSSKLRK